MKGEKKEIKEKTRENRLTPNILKKRIRIERGDERQREKI